MKLIECPRDAMQGIEEFIPTELKTEYINSLLNIGFDTIDFGSFVSPKAIPQMRDTAEVLKGLTINESSSSLLAIIANKRGAEDASQFDEISYLGFPFSVSETFQLRNTNSTIEQSLHTVDEIQKICITKNKKMVVYLSMGFGNPYGEDWSFEIVEKWSKKLSGMGIKILALSDTIGVSNPENISYLFSNLIPALPEIEFGAHLHSTPYTWKEKMDAAYKNGCRRFDSAIKGFGGCPMATDNLTGNIATENVLAYLTENNISHSIDSKGFQKAMEISSKIFH
jgi:hydroxymethylglutaryl-CoA lyase